METDSESLPGQALIDRLEATRLLLEADRVLITEVSTNRQYVLLRAGTPLPVLFSRSMPLSHSICQHVIGMRFPLTIEDAFSHPLLKGCQAVTDLAIGAYLGFPFGKDFPNLAMCALCMSPRAWTPQDRYVMNNAIAEIRQSQAAELRLLSELARRSD